MGPLHLRGLRLAATGAACCLLLPRSAHLEAPRCDGGRRRGGGGPREWRAVGLFTSRLHSPPPWRMSANVEAKRPKPPDDGALPCKQRSAWNSRALATPGLAIPRICFRAFHPQSRRAAGTRRDQQQEFFIGGSLELADPSYPSQKAPSAAACITAAPPSAALGGSDLPGAGGCVDSGTGIGGASSGASPPLNKYGFKTVSSGTVKLRLQCLQQVAAPEAASFGCEGAADTAAAGAGGAQRRRAGGDQRQKTRRQREVSLAVVLERARARLEDARAGGGGVALRAGAAVAPPSVRRQPADVAVDEGATVAFSVEASVSRTMPWAQCSRVSARMMSGAIGSLTKSWKESGCAGTPLLARDSCRVRTRQHNSGA
jgi:hypothetical protein